MQYYTASLDRAEIRTREFVSQTYGWMAGGLTLTALISMWIASNINAIIFLARNPMLIWILFFIQLGMVFAIGTPMASGATSTILFIIYSGLTGVTLSSIFLVYTKTSIALAFFSAAGMFGITAIYGYTTKTDLTKAGNIAFMALIGIIIASLLNIFFKSSSLQMIISIIGVVVFSVLTAYDNQKLKQMAYHAINIDEDTAQKFTINAALMLYLDFINLFLFLLQLMGRQRD